MKSKELAKLLGVSPSTVSVVLNGKPGISDSLRASLEEKIRALGYGEMLADPGKAVRSGNGQPVIAYLIYMDLEDWSDQLSFFPGVLSGAELEAREMGASLEMVHIRCEKGAPLPEILRRRGNVIGCVVQAQRVTQELLRDTQSVDVPCVFMDSYDPDLPVSSVNIDNRQAMHAVIKHLTRQGHRRIGYVWDRCGLAGGQEEDYILHRRAMFYQAMFEFGLERDAALDLSYEDDEGRLRALLQREDRPTAFAAQGDRHAMWVMDTAKSLGLRVPEDVSVVGFDNTFLCEMTRPRLTSVRNSSQFMGRNCVQLLQTLRRLRASGVEDPRLKFYLPAELVERDSVSSRP